MKITSNRDMTMRKEVIITDWDGVIQMIDKAWCYLVKANEDVFSKWFDFSKLETFGTNNFIASLFNRDKYYLNEWLLKEGEELPEEVYNFFMRLYAECDYFYDGCDFLAMMDSLAIMAKENSVKEIIILTHVPYQNGRDYRKEKIFREKIQPISNKFKLVQIHTSKSKADWIKENKEDFTILIEDRDDIIREVTEKISMFEKFIFMPSYGYNKAILEDEEYLESLVLRNCMLYTYPVKILVSKSAEYDKFKKDSEDLYEKLNAHLNEMSKRHFDEIEEMGKFDFQRNKKE